MSFDLPTYEQAAAIVAEQARYITRIHRPPTEHRDLASSSGRILAEPVCADDDQPPFPRSTRDGYACRAIEASAHVQLAVAGSTHAGQAPAGPLPSAAAWEIMTGAPVPDGADCVVMLEHIEKSDNAIRLLPSRTIAAGDNLVAQGAQAFRGDQLLSSGALLGPAQIALAASCGYATLEVFVRPRVAILTTGDELVPIDTAPGPGKIRNSNASMLASLVARAGGDPIVLSTAADTEESLDASLAQAMQSDMILISGGVSAGKYDLVEPALTRLGAKFHFTGVKIQPGKPLVFGYIPLLSGEEKSPHRHAELLRESEKRHRTTAASTQAELHRQSEKRQGTTSVVPQSAQDLTGALAPARDARLSNLAGLPYNQADLPPSTLPVLGLPGNPISSAVTFLLFAAPILAALAGSHATQPRFVLAHLLRDTDRKAKPGLTRFLPALCAFDPSVNQPPQVVAIPWHGSGDLTAFAQSNCLLVIPEEANHLEAGSTVRILLH